MGYEEGVWAFIVISVIYTLVSQAFEQRQPTTVAAAPQYGAAVSFTGSARKCEYGACQCTMPRDSIVSQCPLCSHAYFLHHN